MNPPDPIEEALDYKPYRCNYNDRGPELFAVLAAEVRRLREVEKVLRAANSNLSGKLETKPPQP